MKEIPSGTEPPQEKAKKISQLIGQNNTLINNIVVDTVDDRVIINIGRMPAAVLAGLAAVAALVAWMSGQEDGTGWPRIGWLFIGVLVASIVFMVVSQLFDMTCKMQASKRRDLKAENEADPRFKFARTIVAANFAWITLRNHYQSVHNAVDGDLGAEGDKLADACLAFLYDGNSIISRAINIFLLKEESGLFYRKDDIPDEVGFGSVEAELDDFIKTAGTSDFGRHLIDAAVKTPV
jgi:hypothetical protein